MASAVTFTYNSGTAMVYTNGVAASVGNWGPIVNQNNRQCVMCGNGFENWNYQNAHPDFCTSCLTKFTELSWGLVFDHHFKGLTEFCQECKRHYGACICPKSEAMRELKK